MDAQLTCRSERLFDAAKSVLVDGYSRPFHVRRPFPHFIDYGSGCWVWDVDGNRRIDFTNNFLTLIHGHCHPEIVKAISEQAVKSACSTMPSELEAKMASEIVKRIPSVEQVRFSNTGTEAVMLSVKMARALTGKVKVAKIEGAYHGQYDLVEASYQPTPDVWGDPSKPNTVARSPETPSQLLRQLIVLPCNDIEATRNLLYENADELAALLIDPMQIQTGFGKPSKQYLRMLREETRKHNILLIFDEVVALRNGYGGTQGKVGILPDITIMGKFLGGGLPIGVVGGPKETMSVFKIGGAGVRVFHSGTFSANPLTLAAGLAALSLLDQDQYTRLDDLTDQLCRGVTEEMRQAGIAGRIEKYCVGVAKLILSDKKFDNWRDIYAYYQDVGVANIAKLQECLFEEGVVAMRLTFVLSTPMTSGDVDYTIGAARRAFRSYSDRVRP